MFGISPERIAEIDDAAAKGVLLGTGKDAVVGPGRPPLFDEELQSISFKEPTHKVVAINKRAEQLGLKRSDYLRQLIDNDLARTGIA